jgi:hypothetical protein
MFQFFFLLHVENVNNVHVLLESIYIFIYVHVCVFIKEIQNISMQLWAYCLYECTVVPWVASALQDEQKFFNKF